MRYEENFSWEIVCKSNAELLSKIDDCLFLTLDSFKLALIKSLINDLCLPNLNGALKQTDLL